MNRFKGVKMARENLPYSFNCKTQCNMFLFSWYFRLKENLILISHEINLRAPTKTFLNNLLKFHFHL